MNEQRLTFESISGLGGMEYRAEVERRQGVLEGGGSKLVPGVDQVGTHIEQQVRDAWRPSGIGHKCEGVDNLGGGGGIFWVEAAKEGQHITKQAVGMLVGKVDMKALKGRVVRDGVEQVDTDEEAHQQIGEQQAFKFTFRAVMRVGTNDFGADEQFDGVGGGGAFGAGSVVVVGAEGDNRSRVVEQGELNERMVEAAKQDATEKQSFNPGEDRVKEVGDHEARERRKEGKIGGCSARS